MKTIIKFVYSATKCDCGGAEIVDIGFECIILEMADTAAAVAVAAKVLI